MGNMAAGNAAGKRINSLLDAGSFVEIGGAVTARTTDFNMQEKETPADGVITGYGVIDETDFCLVLSNLLENALEASLKTAKFRQRIDIKIYRHASNLILIQIENAFDGKIQQNHGIFLSSKRNQNGIGIQSVRHIVEKTGGGCDFTYDNGIFTAKIMLRPCINS